MQATVLNPLNQWLTVFRSFSSRIKALENRRLGMGTRPKLLYMLGQSSDDMEALLSPEEL